MTLNQTTRPPPPPPPLPPPRPHLSPPSPPQPMEGNDNQSRSSPSSLISHHEHETRTQIIVPQQTTPQPMEGNDNQSRSSPSSLISHHEHETRTQIIVPQQTTTTTSSSKLPTTIAIRSAITPGDIVKILITPEMTHDDLAHCIAHVALSPPQIKTLLDNWNTDEGSSSWTRIAGLFRESDCVFIPISLILQNPESYQHDLFRVSRLGSAFNNHNNSTSRRTVEHSHFFNYVTFCGFVGALVGSYVYLMNVDYNRIFFDHFEYYVNWIFNLPSLIINTCVDEPLKELYRYGPSVIGWEGASLPKVCAQITHMGDDAFWSRNLEECEKIYRNKETAMLHVRKPILFIVLLVTFFFACQSILHTWAIKNQNRTPPEMIETYEAFRLMMRVLRRGMTPTTHHQSSKRIR